MAKWKKLPPMEGLRDNHVRWSVGDVEVTAYQPEVDPCDEPETCDPDQWWAVDVNGITLDSDIEETARFQNLASLRMAVEPVLAARKKAVEVRTDFRSMSPTDVAQELYGIIRRGYNPWEAWEWSTANDRNGTFRSFFLREDSVREHIDDVYLEWIDDYSLDRSEIEGLKKNPGRRKNPGTSAETAALSKRMMNPRNY